MLHTHFSRWLLDRISPGMEDHAAETTLQLINRTNVRSSLYMALCEFEALQAPADWELLRKLGGRFAALCCPNDIWFPHWKWRQMLEVSRSGHAAFVLKRLR